MDLPFVLDATFKASRLAESVADSDYRMKEFKEILTAQRKIKQFRNYQ